MNKKKRFWIFTTHTRLTYLKVVGFLRLAPVSFSVLLVTFYVVINNYVSDVQTPIEPGSNCAPRDFLVQVGEIGYRSAFDSSSGRRDRKNSKNRKHSAAMFWFVLKDV